MTPTPPPPPTAVDPLVGRVLDGRYRIEVLPALADFPSRDATADTARVMATLESLIRRCPEQYLWLHQRFKRQPDGSKRRYD